MTLKLVNPCCRCPRSSKGITAAFLYCGGYRFRISSTSLLFCSVNLKGMLALFTGLSRCCKQTVSFCRPQAGASRATEKHTTAKASLASLELAINDRHCVREAMRVGRKVDRKTKGVILDAIVAVMRRNGWVEVLRDCRDGSGAFEMSPSDWRQSALHHVTSRPVFKWKFALKLVPDLRL